MMSAASRLRLFRVRRFAPAAVDRRRSGTNASGFVAISEPAGQVQLALIGTRRKDASGHLVPGLSAPRSNRQCLIFNLTLSTFISFTVLWSG
jgi:hypothetical protein